jgi:hypothetical protein
MLRTVALRLTALACIGVAACGCARDPKKTPLRLDAVVALATGEDTSKNWSLKVDEPSWRHYGHTATIAMGMPDGNVTVSVTKPSLRNKGPDSYTVVIDDGRAFGDLHRFVVRINDGYCDSDYTTSSPCRDLPGVKWRAAYYKLVAAVRKYDPDL